MEKIKQVYVAMSADILHHGHLNVLKKATELGDVTVGLHTDEVIASYWRPPVMSFRARKIIMESLKGVTRVIAQDTLDQVPNIEFLKPDFVVHGDDWKSGLQQKLRERVIATLSQWQGELIEVPYTQEISISTLESALSKIGITPSQRMQKLKKLLECKKPIRILEAHNGLTGLIVEKTRIENKGKIKEFDGIWVSSLCDSTAKGKPDIELVDLTSRLGTINDILEVTTKPIILDGDTGGKVEHFIYTVKTLERLGVSAIIIEDKIGLKKNSLFGTDVLQTQDSIENFCFKIEEGRKARVTQDFMIIARIESLILKAGLDDAIKRAEAYITAGADAIMIHSEKKDGEEIVSFVRRFNDLKDRVPLVLVPSAYNHMHEEDLMRIGADIIIYANHLIRSAYPAMKKTAESILLHERSLEASDKYCMPIKEILTLVPGGK